MPEIAAIQLKKSMGHCISISFYAIDASSHESNVDRTHPRSFKNFILSYIWPYTYVHYSHCTFVWLKPPDDDWHIRTEASAELCRNGFQHKAHIKTLPKSFQSNARLFTFFPKLCSVSVYLISMPTLLFIKTTI